MPRHPDRLIERIAQPQAARLIEASGVAVVFAGSVEQHGGHLPLGTDAFAAQSIAERVAARLGTVAASLGPVGVAHYHGAWPGTLSLSPGTLIAVFNDVCGGLAAAGAHRIVSVNWHEGNSATLRLAADEAQQRHGVQVVMAETHVITHTLFPDEMEFTHAGSMETAAVLAFDPSLVHLENATPASDRTAGEAAHALFRRPDVYPVMRDFHDVAATGWYGRPELATPERAEEIAEAVADHVVRQAREIWHALREGDHHAMVPQAPPPAPPFGAPPGTTKRSAREGGNVRSMQAALLREFGSLEVAEVPMPEPGPGEVLVRVRACGICGTDLKIVAGAFQGIWPPALPFIIGHEWSGEVAALGPGTERSGLAVGDRVVAENHTGCGACPMCRAGRYNLCERVREPGFKLYGHTAPGALAQYAVRPAVALHKVPATVSDTAAALVNQGALTVHAARRARLSAGASVAVFGPGLLGLLMLQVARASGATTVIVVGRGPRLDIARDLGCTAVVDYSQADPVTGVRAATGGRGADCVFDCSGNPAVLGQALRCARRGGTVALLGLAGGATAELPVDLVTLDELDVLGIRSSPNAYPAMIALLAAGAIRTEPLTTHVYPLADVATAFDALARREAIRPILTP